MTMAIMSAISLQSELSVEAKTQDRAGSKDDDEVEQSETKEATDRTPRPEDYGESTPPPPANGNSRGDEQHDIPVLGDTNQSPYLDRKRHSTRRGRLSIDNLVRKSPIHSDTCEKRKSLDHDDKDMDTQVMTADHHTGFAAPLQQIDGLTAHERPHNAQIGNVSSEQGVTDPFPGEESFAALSNASQSADFSTGQHSFLSLDDSGMYSASAPPSAMALQHSTSLNENTSRQGEEQTVQSYGRTRSGTVRRYPSSNSTSSAPPQMGEMGGVPGESTSFQGSPANASPFLPSGSASDSNSTQSSPHYLRSALHAGHSQSPQLQSHNSWNSATTGSGLTDNSGSGHSLSRSPPAGTQHGRKKRNKCTPEQYRQLEAFFAKNRNPTGKVREELSKSIKMPERSVQVWFQNKRAKTKLNEIKEGIPPEQRTTVSRPKVHRSAPGSNESKKRKASVTSDPVAATSVAQQEDSVIQLPATSLCVGEWRRIKPLICLFSRRNQCFTWYLSSESVGFKLESPRNNIKSVTFMGPRNPTMHEFGEGINSPLGHLVIELERPPQFYMEVFRSSGKEEEDNGVQRASWRQCSDFTEGKQATNVMTHVVCGPFAQLRAAAVQLQQTGGTIGQLITFQDGNAGSGEQATWLTSLQAPVHEPVHYTAQHISAEMPPTSGPFPQHAWATPTTSSPWITDFHHDAGDRSAPSNQVSYPATPHSASGALDMSNLRLDSAAFSSSSFDTGAIMPHGLPATTSASHSQSHFAMAQWPQTAGHSASSWAPVHGHLSGAASAPPYNAQGFEQQQQERPSMSASHFCENNPMRGV